MAGVVGMGRRVSICWGKGVGFDEFGKILKKTENGSFCEHPFLTAYTHGHSN